MAVNRRGDEASCHFLIPHSPGRKPSFLRHHRVRRVLGDVGRDRPRSRVADPLRGGSHVDDDCPGGWLLRFVGYVGGRPRDGGVGLGHPRRSRRSRGGHTTRPSSARGTSP